MSELLRPSRRARLPKPPSGIRADASYRTLKQRYAECGQQTLQDCGNANQHHQDLKQIGQSPVAYEFVDDPKQDRADDNNDQDVYQDQNQCNLPLASPFKIATPEKNRR
jgi:hypothetical protein